MPDTQSQTYVVLAGSAPFKGLDMPVLDGILKSGMMLEAKAGDVVYYENMRGGLGLYVVIEGEVEIFRGGAAGERHLATVTPGECFGEFSLIDGRDSSASARALRVSRLFFYPRARFQLLVDSDLGIAKQVYHNLLKLLITRLRATTSDVAGLAPG